jgi:autoinducer 2-degrading protein
MFVLLVTVQVRPGMREDFLKAIGANAKASVRDEPGCLRFDVCQLEDDPDRFIFYEIYVDAAGFDAHLETPHFRDWVPAARRCLVEDSQVNTRTTLVHNFSVEAAPRTPA